MLTQPSTRHNTHMLSLQQDRINVLIQPSTRLEPVPVLTTETSRTPGDWVTSREHPKTRVKLLLGVSFSLGFNVINSINDLVVITATNGCGYSLQNTLVWSHLTRQVCVMMTAMTSKQTQPNVTQTCHPHKHFLHDQT